MHVKGVLGDLNMLITRPDTIHVVVVLRVPGALIDALDRASPFLIIFHSLYKLFVFFLFLSRLMFGLLLLLLRRSPFSVE